MKSKVILLKVLFSAIIMCTVTLCVTITPGIENAGATLNMFLHYDSVPYLDNVNEIALLDEPLIEENNSKEINQVAIETFKGTITAYGPDCVGCSGITASGYKVAENINGKITSTTLIYNDKEYGEVRVLAAAPKGFSYGSIIKVTGERIDGYILGIVLDTGGAMRNAWGRGEILMDLLFASEKDKEVYDFGRQKNVTFEVLRYGF